MPKRRTTRKTTTATKAAATRTAATNKKKSRDDDEFEVNENEYSSCTDEFVSFRFVLLIFSLIIN